MELSTDIKLEILDINLVALVKSDKRSGIIVIDEATYKLWIDYLIGEERYEDCKILSDNKSKFII
jgi:hypothetical protein